MKKNKKTTNSDFGYTQTKKNLLGKYKTKEISAKKYEKVSARYKKRGGGMVDQGNAEDNAVYTRVANKRKTKNVEKTDKKALATVQNRYRSGYTASGDLAKNPSMMNTRDYAIGQSNLQWGEPVGSFASSTNSKNASSTNSKKVNYAKSTLKTRKNR
jgi:hypothetical protein